MIRKYVWHAHFLQKMTSNLKAPFVINADTRKGCQVVVDNTDYPVKFPVYEQFRKMKEAKGDDNVC